MGSRRFWSFIRRHLRAYLLGYAAALCAVAAAQVAPWVLRAAVDRVQRGAPGVEVFAAALLGLALGEAAFSYAMRWQILGAAFHIEAELRDALFAHLQGLDASFFHRWRTGDLLARAVSDVRAVQRFAGVGLMRSFHTVVMVASSVAFMLATSPRLTAVTMAILPAATVLFVALGRRIHRRFEVVQERFSDLSVLSQENFSGIRVVKAYAREAAEVRRFRAAVEDLAAAQVRLARVQGALWPAVGLVLGTAAVALLWEGGRLVASGELTLGQLVQFSYYLARLSFPMVAAGWVLNLWQQGRASMARLEEVFRAKPRVQDPPAPVVLPAVRGDLQFSGVWFGYDGRAVLRGVDLHIPAGRTVALVGPTGAGKTTLVSLVPRLFDPTQGSVRLDGVDLRELPLRTVRGAVGFVSQDPFLFSDTLYANVALGSEDDRRVREAFRMARLAKDLDQLPGGHHVLVGERGVTLSGGQRQRAALARALARDPRILILDDALSSVDAQTEAEILAELRSVLRSRTAIVITHRLAALEEVDWIVVLDAGRVVEEGTHRDLLRNGGLYAELYEQQRLREALELEAP
ncbi:MAG: ABC transporter ATP-binding protein [Armatimonadota bacterium]|nr:ABC transporter ATP-binding protein [Armatimonadota bacterium]MDR7430248.1 ABC transporter ATP-binding protein [Armatimonadota bacterium]MDR7432009.1 ABC transporter ATP-binding protein [Armatimonadota bacterium]MDR7477675.1 ABC transporter ATP-binding protein [Armatimonadota bacterium]MDR7514705.1 ABC transporter ATP-binding protein [Armatimonadota bacterium]